MKSAEQVGVVQFGLTGPVANRFREFVAQSDVFQLEAIATANQPELHKKKLGETGIDHPASLADVPIMGVVEARDNTDAPLAFSGLKTETAARFERGIAEAGKLVVTNASANRMQPDVALVSSFVNPHHIDELFAGDTKGKIIAGGNCMVDVIAPTAAAIHREIGIESMSVRSAQGWSGSGATKVPDTDRTRPITGDEEDKIKTEPNKILGDTMNEPEDILIGATPKRGAWLDGHKAEIVMLLSRETSKREIEELLRGFEAPEELSAARSLLKSISRAGGDKRWPSRHGAIHPIKLEHGDLVRTDLDPPRLDRLQPMRTRAHIISFDPEDSQRVVLEVSGHNLWLGAVGGNMLNAAYAYTKGYLG